MGDGRSHFRRTDICPDYPCEEKREMDRTRRFLVGILRTCVDPADSVPENDRTDLRKNKTNQGIISRKLPQKSNTVEQNTVKCYKKYGKIREEN